MQAGLDRADRVAGHLMNFFELVAFGVVQEHDQSMLLAEGGQCPFQLHYVIQALRVTYRIEVARQRFQPAAWELALRDAEETGPGDEQSVGLGLVSACEPKCEAVQPLEMWP